VTAVPANAWPGCVFVFRDGAHFDLNNSLLNCSATDSSGIATGFLPCSFAFTDTSRPTASYRSITSGSALLTPIPYNAGTVVNPIPAKFPIVTSNSANNSIVGPNTGPAAVTLAKNGGAFDVAGTIFAPFGTVTCGQNASPTAGQTIADIVSLQGGSFATGITAYSGGVVAPAPGPALLFE
jgi:hypothetical protein